MTVEVWNDLLERCIRAIRRIDGRHTVIIGAVNYSNVSGLEGLVVPGTETNAIVTFHFYTPGLFCMQGKDWAGSDFATTSIVWPGPPPSPVTPAAGVGAWVIEWLDDYNTVKDPEANPGGRGIIREEITRAADWGAAQGRPLWMSEFTAQDGGDIGSRANWIGFVREQLDSHRVPWSFWTLASDMGTRIYDPDNAQWDLALTRSLGLSVAN